jgi:mannose-6-phosphate isomerase-like protein (cupin superfamily)
VHEHSDRFIFVESGSGFFHFSDGALATFDGRRVVSLPVGQGDMILFTRDVLHTFSAPDQSLNLLSYHSPEIGFDDPRQFTLPRVLWRPNDKGNAKNVAQP